MKPAALLQLASSTLPVGAYSYSQGLESAIDAGLVRDEASALVWIGDGLTRVLARYEAPVWLRLHRAFAAGDVAAVQWWNEDMLATRETHELRSETMQMGYSLIQLLRTLGHPCPVESESAMAYTTAHAWACTAWNLSADDGLVAYLYGWTENQVMAALKTVPLGQTAGQRLLVALRRDIEGCAARANQMEDEELGTQSPMLSILSCRHESQYSRLFRS